MYVITPKHIINYRHLLTCAGTKGFKFTFKCSHVLEWCKKKKEKRKKGGLVSNVRRDFSSVQAEIRDSSPFMPLFTKQTAVMAPVAIILAVNLRVLSFKQKLAWKMACSDLDQVQSVLVCLHFDGRQGMGQQLEEEFLALVLEEGAGLIKLPPGHKRKSKQLENIHHMKQ